MAARAVLSSSLFCLCLGNASLPGAEVIYLEGHAEPVRDVGVSPDGKWLVSVGDDSRLIVRPTDDLQRRAVCSRAKEA